MKMIGSIEINREEKSLHIANYLSISLQEIEWLLKCLFRSVRYEQIVLAITNRSLNMSTMRIK